MMQSYHSKRGETKRTKKARIVPQQRRQCRPTYIPVAMRLLANCYTPFTFYLYITYAQWCIAKNGGGYTQRGVAKGLKVPCLFMITEAVVKVRGGSAPLL